MKKLFYLLLCLTALGVHPAEAQSRKLLKAARQGDAKAQYELGMFYLEINKKSYNRDTAYEWLLKSATQGYKEAQFYVGYICFVSGRGDEGVKWSKAAALQGDPEAMTNLFVHYRNNNEWNQAMEWVGKAVEAGSALAYYQLGMVYYAGAPGIARDYAKAFANFRESSTRECMDGRTMMGVCLLNGQGTDKDEQQAFLALNAAAVKGNLLAKRYLAKCYREGLGVEKNESKAEELEKNIDLQTMSLHDYTLKYWNK